MADYIQEDDPSSSTVSVAGPSGLGGTIRDRFNMGLNVVVNARSNNTKRSGFELRLPSMALFTSKMSNQNLFLRMLKVVVQLKEAAKKAAKKASTLSRNCELYLYFFPLNKTFLKSASQQNEQRLKKTNTWSIFLNLSPLTNNNKISNNKPQGTLTGYIFK